MIPSSIVLPVDRTQQATRADVAPSSTEVAWDTLRTDLRALTDRLENWREIYTKKRVVWSIHETAEALGRPRDQLLMWLRAGMPYVTAGSWETGDGFHLCPAWTIDWYITTKAVVQASGSSHIAQQLGIS
jgi:hypothetical protein